LSRQLLAALLVVCSSISRAQVPSGSQQPAPTPLPDGGVRETLESINIPPVSRAPFTLTLQTEWIRLLGSVGTYTLTNERRIARDSRGRIYEERWYLVPKDGKVKSKMNVIQIADVSKHTLYNCFTDGRRVCHLLYFDDSTVFPRVTRETRMTPLPNDEGFVSVEDLGDSSTEGVETIGTRHSTTFKPGVLGNDNQFTVEREYWYSPKLGINLVSKISDPRFGTQTFTATNVQPSEPDPSLFEVPKGFSVIDERGHNPSAVTPPPPLPRAD
jgi:hypothetical protein